MSEPTTATHITGVAAGVPFLAIPPSFGTPAPAGRRHAVPIIVAWHLMDPPRSEAAFAAALPLNGLNAWRIYLGLPMCGARLPSGGPEALMRLFYQDAVLKGYQPIAKQGAAEFPAALMAARQQLGLDRLHSALTKRYSDPARVDLIVVPGMGHALAEEPGISPAPQTEPAAAVDQHAMSWLRAHLPGCTM